MAAVAAASVSVGSAALTRRDGSAFDSSGCRRLSPSGCLCCLAGMIQASYGAEPAAEPGAGPGGIDQVPCAGFVLGSRSRQVKQKSENERSVTYKFPHGLLFLLLLLPPLLISSLVLVLVLLLSPPRPQRMQQLLWP